MYWKVIDGALLHQGRKSGKVADRRECIVDNGETLQGPNSSILGMDEPKPGEEINGCICEDETVKRMGVSHYECKKVYVWLGFVALIPLT